MGVIRYGHDEIVAILDSTMAGRNLREFLPALRRPVRRDARRGPRAARSGPTRCSSASPRPAAAAARLGGRRSSRRSRAGLDVHSGLHQFLGDDPRVRGGRRGGRHADRSTTGARRTGWRRPSAGGTVPGKRVILTVGTDCAIGKMSVALELVAAARRDGAVGGHGPDRPDRDDDRGLGRGRRPGHQRLHQRDRRVARRAGRGAAATGCIVEGQGSIDHPAYSAVTMGLIHGATPARDGPRPQARPRPSTTSTTCPRRRSRSPSSAVHRAARADRRPRRAVEGRGAWRSTRRSSRTTTRLAPSSMPSRPRPACPPTTRSGSAPDRLWPAVRDAGRRPAVGLTR